jgi:hypothetical protein
MTDKEILDGLEKIIKDGSIWQDWLLAYDHEDGIWLAHVERGTVVGLPLEIKGNHPTIRAALEAALKQRSEDEAAAHP